MKQVRSQREKSLLWEIVLCITAARKFNNNPTNKGSLDFHIISSFLASTNLKPAIESRSLCIEKLME